MIEEIVYNRIFYMGYEYIHSNTEHCIYRADGTKVRHEILEENLSESIDKEMLADIIEHDILED